MITLPLRTMVPLTNKAQPGAVPTAILSNENVEDWFIAPTRCCATDQGEGFTQRVNILPTNKDPKSMIPEASSVLKAWADFMYDMQPCEHNSNNGSITILVVNRLSTPLTVRLEGGDAIHGNESAFPARRTWDARHLHHQWENADRSYTIPPGNHRSKTCGVGVLGITLAGLKCVASAVWSITPEPSETNLRIPLWFGAYSWTVQGDDAQMGVSVTDDIGGYASHKDFYDLTLNANTKSSSQCSLRKGDDPQHPDANFTAEAYIAMLEPAPGGYLDPTQSYRRNDVSLPADKNLHSLQAVLVIDTEAAHGKSGGST